MSDGKDSATGENLPQKPTASAAKQRRSSLFEVGFPVMRDRGSSMVSIPNMVPSQIHHLHQKVRYENTYKMEPDKRFHIPEVKEIMDETLETSLKDVKYDPIRCKVLSESLSRTICERVKLLGFSRFKIVCVVNIGEMKGQDVRVASRFLWDEKHDNWVDSVFTSSELFGVAVVFGVYQEWSICQAELKLNLFVTIIFISNCWDLQSLSEDLIHAGKWISSELLSVECK